MQASHILPLPPQRFTTPWQQTRFSDYFGSPRHVSDFTCLTVFGLAGWVLHGYYYCSGMRTEFSSYAASICLSYRVQSPSLDAHCVITQQALSQSISHLPLSPKPEFDLQSHAHRLILGYAALLIFGTQGPSLDAQGALRFLMHKHMATLFSNLRDAKQIT